MKLKSLFLSLVLIIFCNSFMVAQKSYRALVYEGNKKYDNKDYDGSSTKFLEAVKVNKNDFIGHYNLGNALFKNNKIEEAQAEYVKANKLAQNSADKMAVLNNIGNTYMKTNNPDKAAEYYKQALKQNPYDETIRKNYSIAKLKEKQQQQKQQKEDQQSGKGGDGKEQDKNKDQKGDSKNKNQDQGNGQQNNGESPNGKNSDQNKKSEGSKMPKELQNAILDKMGEKEKETARRILNKNSYSMPQSREKDW